jgi:ABC-type sugar transport system ATPase subunit
LGIRPEDIQVAQSPKAVEKYSGAFRAIIDLVEATGAEALIYLQTGAHTLVCHSRGGADHYESGHRSQFQVALEKVHLFDPASTRRLGPGA